MPTFTYPLNSDLIKVLPEKAARLVQNRLGFQLMPVRNVNAALVQWEQKDNYIGLQQLRGLDGAPQHVSRVGSKLFSANPGVYGEFATITETELTTRAGSYTGGDAIDVGDLVADAQDMLLVRERDRIEQVIFALLTTGTYSVLSANGVVATDIFSLQTASRAVAWATVATATPLVDLRAVQLKGRGYGVNFGRQAMAIMNRSTANNFLGNTNASDLGGKRYQGGSTINNVEGINQILMGEDLPIITIYDEGYYDATNTWQLFVPNNVVVVVGKRQDSDPIGEYVMTRNANNPGLTPGRYQYIVDRINATNAEKRTPPNIEVHEGHSGGPTIYHPNSIVVLTV